MLSRNNFFYQIRKRLPGRSEKTLHGEKGINTIKVCTSEANQKTIFSQKRNNSHKSCNSFIVFYVQCQVEANSKID